MKLTLNQRISLISLAGMLVTGFVVSQIYMNRKSREEIKDIAEELALLWRDRLFLDDEQTSKMEDLIIEYTLKKNEIINSSMNPIAQVRKLKGIQKSEHRNLAKLLSKDQFEKYLNINKEIRKKS
ncbi:hypothetical protein [Zunongwangia atlantica]|uniref:Uncharacterized protein n=1 Tax=Zunongwangia atlantica 22II14-10F7 TaxID=1185767 RepID=A0A1Y1T1C2_9FLAO|nr:hypothetical protein [Zunongwangia atlantica]ORL44283.1 hypothetical protein IIF7_16237 [Zunongwangia atlantica 22II14-10F7]